MCIILYFRRRRRQEKEVKQKSDSNTRGALNQSVILTVRSDM